MNPNAVQQSILETGIEQNELDAFRAKHFRISSTFNHAYLNKGKEIEMTSDFKTILLQRLLVIHPIFAFYTYNVDKNIRKYSRGKSGKYLFI